MMLSTNQRRALKLLADAGPNGFTEHVLLVHGFDIEMLIGLAHDGLATTTVERVKAGRRTIEIVRLRITDAGLRALAVPTRLP
jgi:hypothetical protein